MGWSVPAASADKPYGIIAGGMEDGYLDVWDPNAIIAESSTASLFRKKAHSGSLKALDFNPFQPNLLATGGGSAEVTIWDINNPDKNYSPGEVSQRLDEITSVAWNRQVLHILATSSNNGNCVIWDLKTRREILHLSSPTKKPFTSVAWNPDVSTQLLTASQDDGKPAIYMWDLRNARDPEKVLTGHTRGVLSISWCPKDSDLLLSCGKDNRTLCWNPKTTEVIGEFPVSNNWSFNVQWYPKNPDLLSVASFDGMVSVYSIQAKSSGDAIPLSAGASSADPFAQIVSSQKNDGFTLKQPPKWLRRPCGAVFGFGNRLACFKLSKSSGSQNNLHAKTSKVHIYQVYADKKLKDRARSLEEALNNGNLLDLCKSKIQALQSGGNQEELSVWTALSFIIENNPRQKLVKMLGFEKEKLAAGVTAIMQKTLPKEESLPPKTAEVVKEVIDNVVSKAEDHIFGETPEDDFLAQIKSKPEPQNLHSSPLAKEDNVIKSNTPFAIYKNGVKDDIDAQITRCVIGGDFASAVDLCLAAGKLDDALMLAVHGGAELLEKAKAAFYKKKSNQSSYLRIAGSVSSGNLDDIIEHGNVGECWKEALAILCTYSESDELEALGANLGNRLIDEAGIIQEPKKKVELQTGAILSYMISGRLDKVVNIWIEQEKLELKEQVQKLDRSSASLYGSSEYGSVLQSLIEKVVVYRKAIDDSDQNDELSGEEIDSLKSLYRQYALYASVLIQQGELVAALEYLNLTKEFGVSSPSVQQDILKLFKDRLYHSMNTSDIGKFREVPAAPFEKVSVSGVNTQKDDFVDQITKSVSTVSVKDTKNASPKKQSIPTQDNYQNYYAPVQNNQAPAQQPYTYNPYQPQQQPQQQAAPYGQTPGYGQNDYYNQGSFYQQPTKPPVGPPPQVRPPVASTPVSQPPPAQNPYAQPAYNPYQQQAPPAQQLPPSSAPLSPTGTQSALFTKPAGSWNDPPADIFKSKPQPKPAAPPVQPQFTNPYQAPVNQAPVAGGFQAGPPNQAPVQQGIPQSGRPSFAGPVSAMSPPSKPVEPAGHRKCTYT